MKVVHVAPPFLAISEEMQYGGTERVINALRKKQREFGLETEIIAAADSRVSGLIPTVKSISVKDIYGRGISVDMVRKNTYAKLAHVEKILAYAQANLQVFLHVHDDFLLPFLHHVLNPSILTIHADYASFWPAEEHPEITKNYLYLIAISESHKRIFESHGFSIFDVVYNGIEIEDFPFSDQKEDYFFSLSAIAPHKGQKTAVEIAKSMGTNLILAGNVADSSYFASFKDKINFDLSDKEDKWSAYQELPSGQKVVYVGPVNDEQKKPLFAQAKAFLMPIDWEEPFGLVMIEALACGTPVVAFHRGAASEIIRSGQNGYLCQTPEEMRDALRIVEKIDSRTCRKDAEERFGLEKMAKNYSKLYEMVSLGRRKV